MLLPKNKSKKRKFFIELNYLDKVDIKEADRLIASGDIGNAIRCIERFMRKRVTQGIKILAKRAPSIKNDDNWREWVNKHLEWINKHQYKKRSLIILNPNPNPNNFVLEDFHDSLEDEGYPVDYGTPSKQDFEIEED